MGYYGLKLNPKRYNMTSMVEFKEKEFSYFINKKNKHLVSEEAMDLLKKLLTYDHNARLLPKEALEHPYFDPVKDYLWKQEQKILRESKLKN